MRTAFITGTSRGIGKAIAERFREEGYQVVAPGREELDLGSSSSVEAYLNANRELRVDVIVNNAGINDIHLIEEITDDEIERTLAINLVAPIKIIRALVWNMKEQNYGKIVNIGSIWAGVSKEGRCVYSATKNGIHGVTNTLAVELANYNILVNTVCPGFTNTELTSKNNTPEQIAVIESGIPMGRMAEPAEIADAVFYLASERNTYLTSQKIMVDGGFTSR